MVNPGMFNMRERTEVVVVVLVVLILFLAHAKYKSLTGTDG